MKREGRNRQKNVLLSQQNWRSGQVCNAGAIKGIMHSSAPIALQLVIV